MIDQREIQAMLEQAARTAADTRRTAIPGCRAELVEAKVNGERRLRLRMNFDNGKETITHIRNAEDEHRAVFGAMLEGMMTAEDDRAKYAGLLRAVKKIVTL